LRASGRLMVRIATCPRRSRNTSSAMEPPNSQCAGQARAADARR
jgi:hypothetical protein